MFRVRVSGRYFVKAGDHEPPHLHRQFLQSRLRRLCTCVWQDMDRMALVPMGARLALYGAVMTFPWEQPAARTVEDTIAAMQRDMTYMVTHTAVLVHSKHPALAMLVNTARGQLVPRGVCAFTDGSTMEVQDVGMPQPGAPEMSVQDLMVRAWEIARELGLELAS